MADLYGNRKIQLTRNEANTVLASLRFYQTFLETGNIPLPERLREIHAIAGDGPETVLSPEDIDELCARINCS